MPRKAEAFELLAFLAVALFKLFAAITPTEFILFQLEGRQHIPIGVKSFFDAGSGICLWAADDEARLTYGYPIDLEQIPISLELINYGSELITRFDKCIDWSNPGSSSLWSTSQKDKFLTDARKFFTTLSSQLHESHTIIWAVSI